MCFSNLARLCAWNFSSLRLIRRCGATLGAPLLQFRVLRLGFLQDGNVRSVSGVGVFPEREKIFVGGERPDNTQIG